MRLISISLSALLLAGTGIAHAASVSDPTGDFLATYTGPQNADLDVLSSEVRLDDVGFTFNATLGGSIGTTPGGFYVFGLNRGQGTARFGTLAPGVLFDSVVVVNNNGTGFARDLLAGVTTNLAASDISFNGSNLSAFLNVGVLGSTGFAPQDFTYNLWPRSPGAGNATIADFAPDNSNLVVTAVPEPAAWAMMICGFGLTGAAMRRRRAVTVFA